MALLPPRAWEAIAIIEQSSCPFDSTLSNLPCRLYSFDSTVLTLPCRPYPFDLTLSTRNKTNTMMAVVDGEKQDSQFKQIFCAMMKFASEPPNTAFPMATHVEEKLHGKNGGTTDIPSSLRQAASYLGPNLTAAAAIPDIDQTTGGFRLKQVHNYLLLPLLAFLQPRKQELREALATKGNIEMIKLLPIIPPPLFFLPIMIRYPICKVSQASSSTCYT